MNSFATLTVLLAAVGKSVVNAAAIQDRANCGTYKLSGIAGGFTQRVFADFSSAKAGGDASSLLSSYGLSISNYPVDDGFIPHTFSPDNVALGDGSLNMKVSAYTGNGNIKSSEIVSNDRMKYASVRTVLKSSSTKGVVEGTFFYLDDEHEIDLEILTTTTINPSATVPAGIWATNHGTNPKHISQTPAFGFDPSLAFHEYRIDWTPGLTTFWIDGVQKAKLTQSVPDVATSWIFNTWSNGDAGWSAGPPTADSTTRIKSIEIYKGYAASTTGTTCAI